MKPKAQGSNKLEFLGQQGLYTFYYKSNAAFLFVARGVRNDRLYPKPPEEVMALDERIAITFTQCCPPIWSTLVRYYEGGLKQPGWFWPMVRAFWEVVLCLVGAALLAIAETQMASNGSVALGVPVQRNGCTRKRSRKRGHSKYRLMS